MCIFIIVSCFTAAPPLDLFAFVSLSDDIIFIIDNVKKFIINKDRHSEHFSIKMEAPDFFSKSIIRAPGTLP